MFVGEQAVRLWALAMLDTRSLVNIEAKRKQKGHAALDRVVRKGKVKASSKRRNESADTRSSRSHGVLGDYSR